MKITTYNSKKIAILNAVAIILVLLLHSYYSEAEGFTIANKIQLFTGTIGLSGVAVPLFYFISGLLFFKSVESVKDCASGIRKRIHTLLVPYVIWNVIFVGWYVAMHFTPGVSQFVNSDILSHFSWSHLLSSLSFLLIEPAGFHLWFLRDLMLYVAFTPLLYYLLKRYPWITLITIYCVFGGISRFGMTYFALGAMVALHYGLERLESRLSKPVVIICGVYFMANAVMAAIPECGKIIGCPYFSQIANTAGILFVWRGYDFALKIVGHSKIIDVMIQASKYSFFIYLFHEPAFNIIKKLGLKFVGDCELSLVTLYFVNPFLIVLVAIAVAMLINKCMPNVYSVLIGGRK